MSSYLVFYRECAKECYQVLAVVFALVELLEQPLPLLVVLLL